MEFGHAAGARPTFVRNIPPTCGITPIDLPNFRHQSRGGGSITRQSTRDVPSASGIRTAPVHALAGYAEHATGQPSSLCGQHRSWRSYGWGVRGVLETGGSAALRRPEQRFWQSFGSSGPRSEDPRRSFPVCASSSAQHRREVSDATKDPARLRHRLFAALWRDDRGDQIRGLQPRFPGPERADRDRGSDAVALDGARRSLHGC